MSKNSPKVRTSAKRKLDPEQIQKILFWIATFVPHKQIVQNCKDEFGKSISKSLVDHYKYQSSHQSMIQQIRDKWGNDLLHVEFANKRRRLEALEKIYLKCMGTNQMKNALASLYQIQHEVEKDLEKLSLTNYNINIYKDMTEEELEEERVKSLDHLKRLKGEITDASSIRETKTIDGSCIIQPIEGKQGE